MTNLKKLLGIAVLVGALGIAGCSGVSEEQIAQLDALRAEVNSLEKEVDALKAEKTKLEREIAERNVKLKDCENMKAETKKNLEKMMMGN